MFKMNSRPALAIDLGGTKIMAAIVSPDGRVISRNYCPTLAVKGTKEVIDRLSSAAEGVVTKAGLRFSELAGIVIAAAGALNAEKGVITSSPNLPGWHNVPLRDILADRLGIATYMINDASAAALGEHRFGAGRGLDNLVYLTVSTGIGGGIIIGGKLYTGANGSAGEIGHMIIEADGPQCSCGNSGCLEALASGTAVAAEAVKRIGQGEASSITELAKDASKTITAKTVALAARQGDYLACDVVAKAAYYLGIGLANVVNIFNPEMVIIGGGMSQMGDMLLKPARKVVKQRAFRLPAQTVRIVRARLGGDAGVIGAAISIFDQ